MKLYATVKNGEVHPNTMGALKAGIAKLEGRDIEIEVKDKKRSLNQNRYRWGVVVETIRQAINHELRGNGLPECSPDDIDLFVKENALGLVHRVSTKYGEITAVGRLKRRTTREFEESMEAIRAWAAEKGISIPLPHEDMYE